MKPILPFCTLLALAAPTAAQSVPLATSHYCPHGLDDAAGIQTCIRASTVPTDGLLYPLGQHFFVNPLGRVGLGTKNPSTKLDLEGAGGNDSTMRLLTTNAGAGGLLLQRSGGTPVDWNVSYETAQFKRDFIIHDNVAAETRLRIDNSGIVMCEEIHIGDENTGIQIDPHADSVSLTWGKPGSGPSTLMEFESQLIKLQRKVDVGGDLLMDTHASMCFSEDDTFGTSPSMIYMFEDGTDNFDRMVLSHSHTFDDWGLRYDDDIDSFHFLAAGSGVMTVKLLSGNNGKVGIEDSTPSNILTVQQNSPTDPIADAWTTYSSRRWKENIEPIGGALGLVERLRGVTFDWKDGGKHDLGMIAEEVAEVVPEVVAFEEDGVHAQSIDYARLTAVLVEGMKEQQALIEELRARVAALEEGAR